MCAFVVLGLVLHWFGECLQNNLFCIEWDVEPQLSQSLSQSVCDALGIVVNSASAIWWYLYRDFFILINLIVVGLKIVSAKQK